MDHSEENKLLPDPCPRCGCHMAQTFHCNCGAVHSDVCLNCGRYTTLPRDEHIEMSEFDLPCKKGTVVHEHPWKEKEAHMNAVFNRKLD